MNSYYSRNYCPFYNTFTKVQTLDLTTKKSKSKKSKLMKLKLADRIFFTPSYTNNFIKLICQEKKKKYQKKKWDKKNYTLATKDNVIENKYEKK